MNNRNGDKSIYDRIVWHIFRSGKVLPGSKIVESRLAELLGVSRIPIREALGRMVGQGLLIGESGQQATRLRDYSLEDIRQLYEMREVLEGAAARAAARAATETDIVRMEMIGAMAARAIDDVGSSHWEDLEHAFHVALANASHNDRIAGTLKNVLLESHYVLRNLDVNREVAVTINQSVLDDHQGILLSIRERDVDGAELKARRAVQKCIVRSTQELMNHEIEELALTR